MTTRTRVAWLSLLVFVLWSFCPEEARAADDFGRIVHHIEARYHVHRNHRFVLAFAGLVVKFWHVGGVKSLKAAIFEDQAFLRNAADTNFDEIVHKATNSGWQPVVQSYSRRSGEHTYIYSRISGKDMRLLIVNLEPREAAVLQVKVDPDKLMKFMDDPELFGKQF